MTQRCCAGKLINATSGFECCGAKIYNRLYQVCCHNQIHDKHDVNKRSLKCCGAATYEVTTQACCHGKIRTLTKKKTECCGTNLINPKTKLCCGWRVLQKTSDAQRCCQFTTEVYSKSVATVGSSTNRPDRTVPSVSVETNCTPSQHTYAVQARSPSSHPIAAIPTAAEPMPLTTFPECVVVMATWSELPTTLPRRCAVTGSCSMVTLPGWAAVGISRTTEVSSSVATVSWLMVTLQHPDAAVIMVRFTTLRRRCVVTLKSRRSPITSRDTTPAAETRLTLIQLTCAAEANCTRNQRATVHAAVTNSRTTAPLVFAVTTR